MRDSGDPFILQPLDVAATLAALPGADADMIVAAVLHDTIEASLENIQKIDYVATNQNDTVEARGSHRRPSRTLSPRSVKAAERRAVRTEKEN